MAFVGQEVDAHDFVAVGLVKCMARFGGEKGMTISVAEDFDTTIVFWGAR